MTREGSEGEGSSVGGEIGVIEAVVNSGARLEGQTAGGLNL